MPAVHVERSANSFEKLCIYLRGLSRSWPTHVSSSLSLPASSFFIPLQGFFFNKIQSEGILEANIHCFVWRLVEEKKDDECVYMYMCANNYVYTVAPCWQPMQS